MTKEELKIFCDFWRYKFEKQECLFCDQPYCTPYIKGGSGGIILCPLPIGDEVLMEEPHFSCCQDHVNNWKISGDSILHLAKKWADQRLEKE